MCIYTHTHKHTHAHRTFKEPSCHLENCVSHPLILPGKGLLHLATLPCKMMITLRKVRIVLTVLSMARIGDESFNITNLLFNVSIVVIDS